MIYRLAILALCFIAAVIKICKNFHKHTKLNRWNDKELVDGEVRPWICEVESMWGGFESYNKI